MSPPAEPETLVRRLYLDLIGFPPSLEQAERTYLKHPTPEAYRATG